MEKKIRFPRTRGENDDEIEENIERLKEEIELTKTAQKELKKLERKKNPKKRKTSAASIQHERRKKQVIAMRLRNKTYDEISKTLGLSMNTCCSLAKEALNEMPIENSQEISKVLTRTATRIMGKFQTLADSGDTKSALVILKALEKVMKLAGLDVSRKQLEVSDLGSTVQEVDLGELDLPLETKRQVLEAIRKQKEVNELLSQDRQEDGDYEYMDEAMEDEE